MQTQTQIQDQIQIPDLHYDTWGTYGQYALTYVILPNDSRIDPRDLITRLRLFRNQQTKTTIDFNGYKVTMQVVNDSSRKNAHYKVKVIAIKPIPEYIVIVREDRSASKFTRSVEIVYADGRKEEPELMTDIKPEEKKNDRYIYRYEIHETYVKVYDRKHVVHRERVYIGKELIGKPLVKILKRSNEVYVYGDTYHVKHILKQHGLRWDPIEKAWHGVVELEEIVSSLKEIAEVKVMG